MMIAPTQLLNEITHLQMLDIPQPLDLLTIDPNAPIITSSHVLLNRITELSRGPRRHGSCGQGIGELGSDREAGEELLTAKALYGGPTSEALQTLRRIQERLLVKANAFDLSSPELSSLLLQMQEPVNPWYIRATSISPCLSDKHVPASQLLFEGAQGVLLDEAFGFHPYTTWSDCTFANAHTLLRESDFSGEVTRLGILRSYLTRHGNGPFPSEDPRLSLLLKSDHNSPNPWQGSLRVGHFDFPLIEYALSIIGPVDQLALSHLDQFSVPWFVATSYDDPSSLTSPPLVFRSLARRTRLTASLGRVTPSYVQLSSLPAFLELVEARLAPIGIFARGPRASDRFLSPLHLTSVDSSATSS
jgi:adenylosuccinate synthase